VKCPLLVVVVPSSRPAVAVVAMDVLINPLVSLLERWELTMSLNSIEKTSRLGNT